MRRLRVCNILLTVLISIGFILLGVFCFSSSYLRLFESLRDLWLSLRFYIGSIFNPENNVIPTVNNYSEVLEWNLILAEDWEGFKTQVSDYFSLLFSGENFKAYGVLLGKILGGVFVVLVIAIPIIVGIVLLMKRLYKSNNNNHNVDTIPLRVFKWLMKYTYQPISRFIRQFIGFVMAHRWIWFCWLVLWIIQLNLATIVVAFFAYYLFFAMSFRVDTLYIQFCKLFIDLQVFFTSFPWWTLVIIALVLFGRFRRKIALSRLRRYENRNCGFIRELPIVSMTCGSMGKKKTTMITDMALSQEVMFREKAFELLQKNDMKFPFFPWISLELDLRKCMEYGTVYNLATIKEWIEKKRKRFEKNGDEKKRLYGYDCKRYGTLYNDGLRIWNLFDVMSTYAQLYFIYIVESSLIISNYSIREDNLLLDEGNFPMWAMDFFPNGTIQGGRHSHILDFDVLRLGKKVIENNPNAGSFEFGVVVISEVGKERGNNLELRDVKKNNDETNQKNDLFNSWLKMCRHSATVDNYPFVRVFTDEQRPESWGADARDLSEVITIVASGSRRLALPFYIFEEMFTDIVVDKVVSMYYDFRYRRGDNTLLMYWLKGIASWLFKRNLKMYNQYGYSVLYLDKEKGTLDGRTERKKYFILNKKIYSKRFSTDCFSDYFNDMARKTSVGINDYLEYETERATIEELKQQNSYFINALYKEDIDSDESF